MDIWQIEIVPEEKDFDCSTSRIVQLDKSSVFFVPRFEHVMWAFFVTFFNVAALDLVGDPQNPSRPDNPLVSTLENGIYIHLSPAIDQRLRRFLCVGVVMSNQTVEQTQNLHLLVPELL